MNLEIYGTSTCAACKTALSMAKANKIEVTYLLIDKDPIAHTAYQLLAQGTDRQLPLVVANDTVVTGLTAAMTLIREIKE